MFIAPVALDFDYVAVMGRKTRRTFPAARPGTIRLICSHYRVTPVLVIITNYSKALSRTSHFFGAHLLYNNIQ